MIAKIVLRYETPRLAETVAKAISPDNVFTPTGLTVKTYRKGNAVITLIECRGKLETFISTINDLLSCIQVAGKSVKDLEGQTFLG